MCGLIQISLALCSVPLYACLHYSHATRSDSPRAVSFATGSSVGRLSQPQRAQFSASMCWRSKHRARKSVLIGNPFSSGQCKWLRPFSRFNYKMCAFFVGRITNGVVAVRRRVFYILCSDVNLMKSYFIINNV